MKPIETLARFAALPLLTLSLGGTVACANGSGCPRVDAPEVSDAQRVLLDPSSDVFESAPPDTFHVRFNTTKGDITLEVITAWAPLGAKRFYHLVRNGFFDGTRFFRVIPGSIVQFGVHSVPVVQAAWNEAMLPDDPVSTSNLRGTLVYATAGPNTRTTQLFINYRDNEQYDSQGFAPIGRVTDGMGALLQLYSGYGEMQGLGGSGIDYACLLEGGEAYLADRFERMDRIESAEIVEAPSPVATFSILAYDPETGEVGGAVQSRVFSVGNGVLWAEAGVGAVATQAIVDVSYGEQALELLRQGLSPDAIIKQVWESDPDPRPDNWSKHGRQFAVIDRNGNVAAYTGPRASAWAGHTYCTKAGTHCTAQGNILAGEAVVNEMVRAYENTQGHISLRLVAALEAGQAAGGDTRGMQSAALLIVKEDGGPWLNNDTVLRLQVDDNAEPIKELRRLVEAAPRFNRNLRR